MGDIGVDGCAGPKGRDPVDGPDVVGFGASMRPTGVPASIVSDRFMGFMG
jgi:hypothetical protein